MFSTPGKKKNPPYRLGFYKLSSFSSEDKNGETKILFEVNFDKNMAKFKSFLYILLAIEIEAH